MDERLKQGCLPMNDYRTTTCHIFLIFSMLFLLLFPGCESHTPLESVAIDKSQTTENFSIDKNLKILHLGQAIRSLDKVTQVSEFIYAQNGGSLYLSHSNNQLGLDVRMLLEIPANSMSQDAEVSLTIDDMDFKGTLDVVFGPHGMTFNDPALLTIKAEGINLSGINAGSLWIYYDNPLTGLWEPMVCERFIISNSGMIHVKNAELPHFSRYAIGEEQ
jgi:hypothetical protein